MIEGSQVRLRLLSYNMQVGIRTRTQAEYLSRMWRHVLPSRHAAGQLDPLAQMLRGHDVVALQEADAGSLRTRSLNLVKFLAERADYPHWHLQINRNLQPIARHALGVLSRFPFESSTSHVLPARLPGRGASLLRLGQAGAHLTIVATHLSLSRRARAWQLDAIEELVQDDRHVVLMGDLNCELAELRCHPFLQGRGFQLPEEGSATHPSWKPRRHLDHILLTPEIEVRSAAVSNFLWSDHLPVAAEIVVPDDVKLSPQTRQLLHRRRDSAQSAT